MKLLIYIVCVNISAYAKFEKDPSNGCAPHSMDHGSSGTLSIYIILQQTAAVTGLNNFKFYTIITEISFLFCLNLERDPTPESLSSVSN